LLRETRNHAKTTLGSGLNGFICPKEIKFVQQKKHIGDKWSYIMKFMVDVFQLETGATEIIEELWVLPLLYTFCSMISSVIFVISWEQTMGLMCKRST
jgi:hypothetical protein